MVANLMADACGSVGLLLGFECWSNCPESVGSAVATQNNVVFVLYKSFVVIEFGCASMIT